MSAPAGLGVPTRRRKLPSPGVLVLAALTYLPALTAAPGRMPTDTKLFLYLDPGRLVADAPFSWDTRQFAGWVPHQTIAYLWPSGPWFWVFDRLGVPDWIAHRLWIGTLLFLGGLGVRWAATQLRLSPDRSAPGSPASRATTAGTAAASVAGIVYALSPYILPYVSRTSVMLLPWAGVGWLVGLTVRAAAPSERPARSAGSGQPGQPPPRTLRTMVSSLRSWRDVGLFGLVVLTIGAVNATALALVAPAPVLWLVHAAVQRSITWRRAMSTAIKLGAISLTVSLWWIVMLVVQGRHGADVLAFSETLEAVSLTSVSTETLRGLGYWLFYVRDPYAFTTTAAIDHLGSTKVILAGYLLVVLCLAGLALVRWSQRRFAAWMVFAGIVLAVGVHPIDHPSPLMAPLRDSALGLALRSSTRALPLSGFGLALGAGALVSLAGDMRLRSPRLRGRTLAGLTSVVLVVVAVAGIPAATSGGYVDPALERDQDVPAAWDQAVAALDAGSSEYRVLQLPGSEFGAFRWGYTVDPPLPGLTDKPLVTRDLLPLGSPGAMDLLYALDNRFQAGTIDPGSIAAIARLLGVDTIWLSNDLAFDRFRTPRPEIVSALFGDQPAGLGAPVAYGEPTVNVPDIAMLDEQELSEPTIGTPLAPVELVPVDDPQAIVRVAGDVVIVAGSGDGVVDAAAAGLIDGTEAIVYAADLANLATALDAVEDVAGDPGAAVPSDALLIVTDSNRDRASQWRGSQDVAGLTEVGGPDRDALREDVADQRLAVFATEDGSQQTVALLDGGLTVRATGYGEPFAFRPEDRPAMAVDGELSTAWRVADRFDPVGEQIELSTTDGTLRLVQQQVPSANRRIGRVTVAAGDAAPFSVDLDANSLAAPGQIVAVEPGVPVTITIESVVDVAPDPTGSDVAGTDSGPSAVGFAEVGPVALETVRLPTAALDTVTDERPLAIVLSRERVRATNRWRADPEPSLRRTFTLPVDRTFDATITLRRNDRAADPAIDALATGAGTPLPLATSNRHLTGVPEARGVAGVDGDPTTAWTTPFGQAVGSSITVETTEPTAGPLTITQPADGRHSTITRLTITTAAGTVDVDVPAPDATGASTLVLPAPIPAGDLTVAIAAVDPLTTTDRRWAERVELPAAITELAGLALVTSPVADVNPCRTDLVAIDGEPIGVTVDAQQLTALAAGRPVDTTVCTPGPGDGGFGGPGADIEFASGDHLITTVAGIETGIDVDRITLRSAVAPVTSSPRPVLQVERSRTQRTVTVDDCPEGCWLILGEGYNPAWTATVDGVSVGAPVQMAGGFNGWWISGVDGARVVEMTWTPQAGLDVALLIAFAAVLACVALVVVGRSGRPVELPVQAPIAGTSNVVESRRDALVAAIALVSSALLVISPSWAIAACIPAVVMVFTRRSRPAALAAAAATAVLGTMVVWRQYRERFFPDAAWPGHFEDLHRAGLFVVVLLLAGTLIDGADRAAPAGTTDPRSPDPALSDSALPDPEQPAADGRGQLSAADTSDPAR